MEYPKIIHLLDNTPSQPSRFREKNWGDINVDSRRTYDINSHIKLKNLVLKSSYVITAMHKHMLKKL